MFLFLNDKEKRIRYWWPTVLLVALFSYFYNLDGLHIPKIGDENVYLQITHRTADAGNWLPLQPADGLENTKPPFLFWQGLVATNWGSDWTLLRLRMPSLFFTILVSILVFLLARRISTDREIAYVSVASFLAFSSTFQHGRPYLVNMPETLFVFIPAFLYIFLATDKHKTTWHFWLASGVSLGLAALYKSFVLIIPLGFSLLLMILYSRKWDYMETLRRDIPWLIFMSVVALLMFSIWPLLDSDPGSIVRNFVFGENVAKLGSEHYFSGLFSGPYPIWRIWLGHLTNAGLMAIPLIALVVHSLRNRQALSTEEKLLWIYVLGFLVVYSIPGQRQENYLLPTVPALAILLGLKWNQFQKTTLLVFFLPLVLIVYLFLFLMNGIDKSILPGHFGVLHYLPVVLALISIAWAATSCRFSAYFFHLAIFLSFISLSTVLSPFESSEGRYPVHTQQNLAGKTVYAPSGFRSRYERYRLLLPLDTRFVGYDPVNKEATAKWLAEGKTVVVYRPYLETDWPGYQVLGQRIDLRSRQSSEEVKQILLERRLDLLFHKEVILTREILNG